MLLFGFMDLIDIVTTTLIINIISIIICNYINKINFFNGLGDFIYIKLM